MALQSPIPLSRENIAVLSCQDGRYRVQDLDSRNGTLVNGSAVEEQWLRHGDAGSQQGTASFLFLEEEELAPIASHVEFEDVQGTAETTVIHPRDVIYLPSRTGFRESCLKARVSPTT